MQIDELAFASSGLLQPVVVRAPVAGIPRDREARVLCAPVLRREGGFLLALPSGSVPPNLLKAGNEAEVPVGALHGPSTLIEVLSVEEGEDGAEVPTGETLSILLVDVDNAAIEHMALYDPASEGPVVFFDPVHRERFPEVGQLLALARGWLRTVAADRLAFYTAEGEPDVPEEEALEEEPPAQLGPNRPRAKRVTTAQLATQMSSLLEVMPKLAQQLEALTSRQEALESEIRAPPADRAAPAAQVPAHQQHFVAPTAKGPGLPGPKEVAKLLGPPPKTRAPTLQSPQPPLLADTGQPALDEQVPPPEELGTALAQQGSALTLLVNHLIAQAAENSGDFGVSGPGGASLSSRGSAKREKLLSELEAHTGSFMVSVMQTGFRRMNPTAPLPRSLDDFRASPPPFRFTEYFEKYGGFGQQRELGLVAYMVAQVADMLMSGEVEGSLDLLSLLLVSLEQANQDHGKWDVAFTLSLFPDPPVQLFQNRSSVHNPRLKAWAPLCPAPWATVALAYLKEADSILQRRQEAATPGGRKQEADDAEQPKRPPRKPRFPKGPRQEK